jgi:hypothetical protein
MVSRRSRLSAGLRTGLSWSVQSAFFST